MLNRQGKKSASTERRHIINVQSVTLASDDEGGFIETWTDIDSGCFAAIYAIRAQQQFDFKSVNVDATHWIETDGALTISEKNRIRFGDRYFEILTIEDIQERGISKWITCKEKR
jgi:SPP1 family predicted phage head-tail adaptor